MSSCTKTLVIVTLLILNGVVLAVLSYQYLQKTNEQNTGACNAPISAEAIDKKGSNIKMYCRNQFTYQNIP